MNYLKWKEISVLTEGICVEAIAGIFHKMGTGGVIVEDPQVARKYINKDTWNGKSVSPDFLDHEFILVKAYFAEDRDMMDELEQSIQRVEETFQKRCKIYVDEVKNEDWEESWKKYYHTFKVGEKLVIKPSWEEYLAKGGEVIIEIDPGMAFGTGIHASTRFCLNFIDEYIKGGEKVIDAGCGSGILSIAAAKLGAKEILAMDIDPIAIRVARENIKLNNLEHIVEIEEGDIIEALAGKSVDIVLANITADVVVMLLPEVAKILKKGGYIFGSGIVDSRWPGVEKKLMETGFEIEKLLQDTDWIGVIAKKL